MLAGFLAVAAAGCEYYGPSFDGTWEGGHFREDPGGYWVLSLTQDGVEISGTACHVEGERFSDSPEIVGRHPYVFIPFAPDADIILKIDGEDRMSATLRGYDVGEFHRVASAEYEECMTSAPPASDKK
jgi:hypothetical protein